MKTAVILGSVPQWDWGFARAYFSPDPLVICADGGIRSAMAAGLRPHVLVGDGDSGGTPPAGVRFVALRPEKDYSDAHAAVRLALEEGARRLVLLGCSGGRADHYLANLYLLETIAQQGASGVLVDTQNEISFFGGGRIIVQNEPQYRYFGLLPIDEKLTGVTLTGVKYPLAGAALIRGDTLCISNEPASREFTVEICSGRAFLVRSGRICPRLVRKNESP